MKKNHVNLGRLSAATAREDALDLLVRACRDVPDAPGAALDTLATLAGYIDLLAVFAGVELPHTEGEPDAD
ncbi:hypothetical protein [Corynebacterium nuruki]|uniref:hypothetical protein n=1 Tax=Corynebacterium nuruki TaxID=1032851 RepID=UPI0039BF6D3C